MHPLAEERITHARALDLIEEHLDESVYFGFLVAGADDSAELVPVDHRIGPLRNLMDPAPPRLNPDQGFYAIGDVGNSYHLPPLTGSVHLRDNGIDFRIADTALIRIAWHGSSEIGGRATRRWPSATQSGSSCPNTKNPAGPSVVIRRDI